MPITYDDLRARIGDKLGYGYAKSNWSSVAVKAERVERLLESALSRFYKPPVLVQMGEREQHQWSFLSPTLTLDLAASQYAYDLPSHFAMLNGPLIHMPGNTDWYQPIQVMGAEFVQTRLSEYSGTGRPQWCGVRVKAALEVHTTQWELIVAPMPDQRYQVKASITINPTVPGAIGDVPLGGQPHEQTLIEACLAECELFEEFGEQKHQARFMECLIASVSHDRQVSSAHSLGYNGDPSTYGHSLGGWCGVVDIPPLTYLGLDTW
jgi:hypothetical protein